MLKEIKINEINGGINDHDEIFVLRGHPSHLQFSPQAQTPVLVHEQHSFFYFRGHPSHLQFSPQPQTPPSLHRHLPSSTFPYILDLNSKYLNDH